jgi:4-amino-4-deoxy-L-arabinose transferase-like glycosyltransferase
MNESSMGEPREPELVQAHDFDAIADLPAHQSHPRSKRAWAALASIVLLLVCLAIFVWTGIRAADFGVNWDEMPFQITPVKTMIETATFLPKQYNYPSFDYWLNLALVAPDFLKATRESKGIPPAIEERPGALKPVQVKILAALDQPAYLLRVRAAYVVVSALAVLWVYLTVLVWGGPPMQAVFAAALVGTSWEIAYHSRWIACDCVLMQFAALTTLASSLVVCRRNGANWLIPAAIAAGLGAATKYTGGTLLIPVLIAAYAVRGRLPAGKTAIGMIVKILVSFSVTFLVITPGTVLQPTQFLADLRFQYAHYKYAGHRHYTVVPGLDHGLRILEYMGMVVFSHYAVIATFLFLLAIFGVYALLRKSGLPALVVIAYPIVSLGFMSTQRVMIVRNDLAAVPAVAVLSSFGLAWLYERLKVRPLRLGLTCLIVAALFTNEAWLIWTGQTVVDRQTDRFARQAADHVRLNPDTKFYLSPRVRSLLQSHGAIDLPNVVRDPARSKIALVCAFEGDPEKIGRGRVWPGNVRDLTLGWFGPYEVNWEYYTDWIGNDRIVILDTARVLKLDVIPGQPASNAM